MSLKLADIEAAYVRIGTAVHKTPVHTSTTINQLLADGVSAFFKCENLQKTGSFKARGAINAVRRLVEEANASKGVVCRYKLTFTFHFSGHSQQRQPRRRVGLRSVVREYSVHSCRAEKCTAGEESSASSIWRENCRL